MVASESGQKQSVKFLQNMVYSTIHPSPPPPQTHTVCIYCTLSLGTGEGGGEFREKMERHQYASTVPLSMGATVHKLGRKYQVNVSPVYKSVKHNAANSVNRSILKKSRHIGFDVFLVHSSMCTWFSYYFLPAISQ